MLYFRDFEFRLAVLRGNTSNSHEEAQQQCNRNESTHNGIASVWSELFLGRCADRLRAAMEPPYFVRNRLTVSSAMNVEEKQRYRFFWEIRFSALLRTAGSKDSFMALLIA